ncbi:unnamed protein product [Periconia digitata]|uniref:SHSP domain-containing protein n=1 Tax=Periconia digitata TaxID=1303443 RepID=A0A9W4UIM8_9PLEO|nr:unnamed protein product [Periconia digitata]
MPSVPYMNHSAPFWDFLASLEQEGTDHPIFSQWAPPSNNRSSSSDNTTANNNNTRSSDATTESAREVPPFGPWTHGSWPFMFGGGQGIPHRGGPGPRRGHEHARHEQHEDEDRDFEKDFERELNKEFEDEHDSDESSEKQKEKENSGSSNDNGEGPSNTSGRDGTEHEGCRRGRGGHRCGGDREQHWGGPRRGGRHGRGGFDGPRAWGPHHPHRPGCGGYGRRGGFGGWGRGGPFGGGNRSFDPMSFVSSLFEQPGNADARETAATENDDFRPDADVFDTPASFVVHVSLPGAKKEDVGVNWNAEKSELSIAGVVYRPGDEKLMAQLAMAERKAGAFERKIRLGTRANPANVDADQISAKLEDGVLRIDIPKMGENGFVEIRKVDIE